MKEGEIKNKLSPAQVSVMLHRVTEPPYFGKYWDHFESGTYLCAACETPLFSSEEKFNSKTGWPSFKKPISERDLQFKSEAGPDDKVEIRCKKCKSHLGYVIAGESPYYRINSVCLAFKPTDRPVAFSDAASQTANVEPVAPVVVPVEQPETVSAWQSRSLLVGALAGVLIGMAGMWMYLSPRIATPAPATATTTTETSTTTDSQGATGTNQTVPTRQEPDTSAAPPPNGPLEAPTAATSTQ